MNEIVKTDQTAAGKKTKKHASFIKIQIKTGSINLNIFPIPLWLTRTIAAFGLEIAKIFAKKKILESKQISQEDLNEVIRTIKKMLKELRAYPPFTIVEVENGDTSISIKTT